MRKAYISIAALLLCGSMLMAQTPANRTAKTTARCRCVGSDACGETSGVQ